MKIKNILLTTLGTCSLIANSLACANSVTVYTMNQLTQPISLTLTGSGKTLSQTMKFAGSTTIPASQKVLTKYTYIATDVGYASGELSFNDQAGKSVCTVYVVPGENGNYFANSYSVDSPGYKCIVDGGEVTDITIVANP